MVAAFNGDYLLTLVGHTYDAALDERLWPGLVKEIAATFDGTSASVRLRNSRTGKAPILGCTDNMLAVNNEEYVNYYWRHDKWANRGAELGMSKVLTSRDLIADEELERSEWYWDWLRKADIFYIVGAVLPAGTDEIVSLGIHRPKRCGNFEEKDKLPVGQFLPHLERALQLRRRLLRSGVEGDAAVDALERTGVAALVLAADGLILYANAQAEGLMRNGDAIRCVHGRLRACDAMAGRLLAAAVAESIRIAAGAQGAANAAFAVPRPDRLPLSVLVAPFRPARNSFGAAMPAAIVFIRDPERPTASQQTLQGVFGLTTAEAAVASALAAGRSVDDIAASCGSTLNTVRTHIKSIFTKTGTSRQAELVARLHSSVAVLQRR